MHALEKIIFGARDEFKKERRNKKLYSLKFILSERTRTHGNSIANFHCADEFSRNFAEILSLLSNGIHGEMPTFVSALPSV